MKRDENDGVQKVSKSIIDGSVTREGTMATIMAEDEDGPHDESGKEPKEGEVKAVKGCSMGKISNEIQRGEEDEIADDVGYAANKTGAEAMDGDLTFDFC